MWGFLTYYKGCLRFCYEILTFYDNFWQKWEIELIMLVNEFFNIPKVIYEVHYTEKYSVVVN